MGCPFSGPKPERSMNSLSDKTAESSSPKAGAAKQQLPAPGVQENPEGNATSGGKRAAIPQIVVTSASGEVLNGSGRGQEQRTIREETINGPYARHRNPSTIFAYALLNKE